MKETAVNPIFIDLLKQFLPVFFVFLFFHAYFCGSNFIRLVNTLMHLMHSYRAHSLGDTFKIFLLYIGSACPNYGKFPANEYYFFLMCTK